MTNKTFETTRKMISMTNKTFETTRKMISTTKKTFKTTRKMISTTKKPLETTRKMISFLTPFKKPSLIFFLQIIVLFSSSVYAQELYVSTEPASTMPRNSIGLRLTNESIFKPSFKTRFIPEIMVGVHKNLMLHANAYLSNFYQENQKLEGYGFYAKYRFLSIDSIQRHSRAAAYIRYSNIKNPINGDEINLEGDNSGIQGGLIFTQLLHKLALSGSVNYTKVFDNNGGYKLSPNRANQSIGYTFSSGYLLFPKVYESYDQPNLNIYLEFLGKSNIGTSQNFMDIAPALQLILNSKTRIDISKRQQLCGNMQRTTKNMYLLRLEYNLFNVF